MNCKNKTPMQLLFRKKSLKITALALILLPTVSFAQTTLPANTEIALKVTLPEAETLWKALRKLPVEEVEQLMGKIRQQVSEQTAPKPVEPPKEDKKDVPAPSKP